MIGVIVIIDKLLFANNENLRCEQKACREILNQAFAIDNLCVFGFKDRSNAGTSNVG